MPRKRPGALRALQKEPPVFHRGARPWWNESFPVPWPTRLDRLSGRSVSAVHRTECRRPYDEGLWPGATATALESYRRFLALPGRPLYLRLSICGCTGCDLQDDVAAARDVLELVLRRLPPRARKELAALLAPLDEELSRRTLPDPFAHRRPWRGDGWWHRRIYHESRHL
ncbi:hypothetical protein [Streptomyces sp. t39]|uniref:hypothetical protein n=1 Tax=Streptomyces sp. t39 TaxID=1828156 RepID=UPI0011CE0AEF|nr:hypothetical protein [Streptomyces sp. t39]TXS52321.1 hypothetical protein EAO77_21295 [Streptomyces sp. t39]